MSAAPPESNRDAVLTALRSLLDTARRPYTITITDGTSTVASFNLPPAAPPPNPSKPVPRPDDNRDLRADILAVLHEAGRRLTTAQILAELNRRQWHHGERTVRGYLGEMVTDGYLDNDPKDRPPGYGALEV